MSRLKAALRNAPLLARGMYEYKVASRFRPLPGREWLFPVTYRCNARCIMCNIWQSDPAPELDIGQWDRVLDDPLFTGIESINLTGGEPTLRPDLTDLAELLMRRLPSLRRLTLTTNALAPRRVVSQCAQLQGLCQQHGVQLFVGISLDGIGETHDRMRSVPGAFVQLQETLDALQDVGGRHRSVPSSEGLRLGINCTLTSRNVQEADMVRRWCAARGLAVNFIIASFADSYYANVAAEDQLSLMPQCATPAEDQDRAVQRQQLVDLLGRLATQVRPSNPAAYFYADAVRMIANDAPRTTPCVFQKDAFILDGRGDLQYCMFSRVLGNVRDQAAGTMYHSRENLSHRREIISSKCRECTITCFLEVGLAKDALRYAGFLMRRRL